MTPNEAPPPRGHSRNHSMPQAPSIQSHNNMMIYPAPGLSPTANPMMPGVPQSHETGPLLPYGGSPTTSGSYRKRKSQATSARAPPPAMMMPPAPPIYGSFEDYTADLTTAPPPPPSPRSASPFSARDELMTLTGRTPPGSPSTRKAGMYTPPQHPRTPRRSPPDSAPTSALRTPGGAGYRAQEDVRVSFSPHTPVMPEGYSSSGRSLYALSAGGSDVNDIFHLEDSYRDLHRGRKHRSPHSLRKMHMRQKSAQLYHGRYQGFQTTSSFQRCAIWYIVSDAYCGHCLPWNSLQS